MTFLPEPVLQHLPILVVLLPMVASAVIVMIGRRKPGYVIAAVASLISFLGSVALVAVVRDGQVISYHLGGWAPPIGIEYRIDLTSALVLCIVSLTAAVALPYAKRSLEGEVSLRHHPLLLASFMLCLTGLLGVVATGDAFNIFVFLEISSLSTYALVAMGAERDKRALSAAYDYLILGTIGATFFVIGLGMLYMSTGTLNLADLAERLPPLVGNRTVATAFAFIVVGMGLKVAVFPLHRWLPGAYAYAPSAVAVFLSAASTKVALYVVLRFFYSVYDTRFGFEQDTLQVVILPVAIVAMFLGSAVAIFQPDFKRLLAWSSIAQVGYMLLGLSLLNISGLGATMAHMFNHAVTKSALFMVAGIYLASVSSNRIASFAGLGRSMPLTSAALVLAGLSLIGVPGTAGFASKWMLLQAAAEQGSWFIAALVVLSSLLAIIYMGRVVEVLYFREADPEQKVTEAPASMLLPLGILIVLIVLFGLQAGLVTQTARDAAYGLISGTFLTETPIILNEAGR